MAKRFGKTTSIIERFCRPVTIEEVYLTAYDPLVDANR